MKNLNLLPESELETFIKFLPGKGEIHSMLQNSYLSHDTLILPQTNMDMLDPKAVTDFKRIAASQYKNKRFEDMGNEEFLERIGAIERDQNTGTFLLRRGTLLFLGKINAILNYYPGFHVDYYERTNNRHRWVDRISDDTDFDTEMNLFNFYTAVDAKLSQFIKSPFLIRENSNQRIPPNAMKCVIRELFVNCLVHADYESQFPSVKIEVLPDTFVFKNPGTFLIKEQDFKTGGISHPRNDLLMKFFRSMGLNERQGFGGPEIYENLHMLELDDPVIDTSLESTTISIQRFTGSLL